MEQFPPIFVISLKNSPRRDIIAQRLNGLKLNFKFIDGIFEAIVKDSLKKVSKNVEILFYDHGKAKSYCWKKTLVKNYRLVHYRKPSKTSKRAIMCTTAYLITLSGAQKLLQIAYPIRMPADYLTGALQLTGLNAYGVEPPCVFRGIDSEIDAMEQR
ncbi:glycosyltransferase family 25 protein [Haemophilus influenzae]|nr:glycosyltransferase family 25 protein [Haemophilus influenzae]